MIQPLFYFPTTFLGIDDNPQALKALGIIFSKNPLQTYLNPKEALNFLQHYRSPLSLIPFLRATIDSEDSDLIDHCPTDFNVLKIADMVEYANRFQEISVCVIDYNMPELNGLDVCRLLKESPIKKILLTGEGDYREAVAAFNEGLIHAFIRKDSPTLQEELTTTAQKLTEQYFFERSQVLLANLETKEPLPLSDPKFIQFFEQWRKDNAIQEYYLMDKTGSFVCLDESGKTHYFVLHTNNSLNTFIDLYEDEVSPEIQMLLEDIKNRQKIPFFGVGQSPWQEELTQWTKYFYPAQVLEGREPYYWTVVA